MIDIKKKIIFTHPPKCAGTTIEAAFKWHPNYVSIENKSDYIALFKRFKHAGLTEHIKCLESLGYSEQEFFKFSCVRNPWDLMVSWYFFDMYNDKQIANYSFQDYIERVFKHRNRLDMSCFFCYNGYYHVDYVIRYENYKIDAERIFKKYDVDWPEFNFNSVSRPKNTPYEDIHNQKTKDIVYKNAKYIINTFKYEF